MEPQNALIDGLLGPKPVEQDRAFMAWFQESKVVDEGGAPLMVFHGTAWDFDAFDGLAYFSDKTEAGLYAQNRSEGEAGAEPKVIAVYLAIRNPAGPDDVACVAQELDLALSNPDYPLDFLEESDQIVTALKERGFDGAIGMSESMHDLIAETMVYVAFDPKQIWLAQSGPEQAAFQASEEDGLKAKGASEARSAAMQRPAARLSGQVATVTISNTHTMAFSDIGRNREVSRILADAANRLGVGWPPDSPFPLKDTNGNEVGRFEILDGPCDPLRAVPDGRVRLEVCLDGMSAAGQGGQRLAELIGAMAIAVEATQEEAMVHVELGGDGAPIAKVQLNPPLPEPRWTKIQLHSSQHGAVLG